LKNVVAVNTLRLGLLLVLVGFFAPIGCNSNGYQIAQGILGNARQAGNAKVLESIEDFYGYALFGVYVSALVGIMWTFFPRVTGRHFIAFICLAVSFALLAMVVLKYRAIRNSTALRVLLAIIPIKVKLLIGGYSMGLGYLAGVLGFVLRRLGKDE
jgi:phosphate/sulfate permease